MVYGLFVKMDNNPNIVDGWRFEGWATSAEQLANFTMNVKSEIESTKNEKYRTVDYKVVELK